MLPLDHAQRVNNEFILLREMPHDLLKFLFGLDVHLIVLLGSDAVFSGLTILRHHDHRRGVRGLETEYEIQEDEGIRIPMREISDHVHHYPSRKKQTLHDQEGPAANCLSESVGQSIAKPEFLFLHDVGIANRG